MRRSSGVLLVLIASVGFARGLHAQQPDPTRPCERPASEVSLEQNFPNPFAAGTSTRIPFTLCDGLFAEGRPVVVTLSVVNVIQQFVAAPAARNHPAGEGVRVVQLEYLTPGRYFAEWDGRDSNGGLVATGTYWVQLIIPGQLPARRRMFVAR